MILLTAEKWNPHMQITSEKRQSKAAQFNAVRFNPHNTQRRKSVPRLSVCPIDIGKSSTKVSKHEQEKESQPVENFGRNENLCTLCEEFTAKAVDYFAENKTQTEIINLLHSSCSHLHSFEEECISVVDYYVPLFFLEISTIQPADFCQNFNLCQPDANDAAAGVVHVLADS
ncbi:hypothetical protein CUMW_001130 [Citrus unshiu]|nr:hypothetical protein CUMW_001130 [Citrus unshiu]